MRVDTGRLRVVALDGAEAAAFPESAPQDDAAPDRLQRDDDLPSPGAYIEAQRRRRGMSIEQLAVVTKIPARSIAALEADRFDELPGQVFVKGFLRCCARALGVSQQAVMDLLYERERATMQARRKDKGAAGYGSGGERSEAPSPEHPVVRRARRAGSAPSPAGGGAREFSSGANRMPPRLRGQGSVDVRRGPSWTGRLRDMVPSAHALLWIVVAVFVAFLVLAAFNLAGSPIGMPQS